MQHIDNTRDSAPIRYHLDGHTAVIAINNPPINAISASVRQSLLSALEKAQADNAQAVLLYGEGKTFIAGADISEFDKPQAFPQLPDVIAAIEACPIPVVVAMHGNALGGGLEIAMAGHYRCAKKGTKLGLPEVNLGLLPGSGGTQRLPRLVGAEKALDMILGGKPISAEAALQCGLLDALVDGPLPRAALGYVESLLKDKCGPRKTSDKPATQADPDLFAAKRAGLQRAAKAILAPGYIIDLVELATQTPVSEGQRVERERFLECRESPASAAIRHLFFAERATTKLDDISPKTPPRTVERVAVIGSGTMGSGIAMCFATAGYDVTLVDTAEANLQRGMTSIRNSYEQSLKRKIMDKTAMEQALGNIQPTTSLQDIHNADLVVEATFESMQVKLEVFAQLDEICKPGCILATNTSYLDVNEIALSTKRPQDVVGAHFFSPAHIMKLLEVVRGAQTADDVVLTVMNIAKRIGKIPVAVGVCHGFVGNRMLRQYARQAQLLLLEGGTPQQIDNVIQQWGMAMGPLSVADLAGLDISYRSRRDQGIESGSQPEISVPDALVESERLGRKTGAGFYCYDPEAGKPAPDASVTTLIEAQSQRWGITRRDLTDTEIVNRLILALVNEGAKILEEGIAARASDIDVVYVNGYGFPRWRGGPMYYAEKLGLANVVSIMRQLEQSTGDPFWKPAEWLIKMAESADNTA